MIKREPIGAVDRKRKVVHIASILALYAKKDAGHQRMEIVDIPIPESLTGCPDRALVYVTSAGLLAWECDGELRTRFDHVNE